MPLAVTREMKEMMLSFLQAGASCDPEHQCICCLTGEASGLEEYFWITGSWGYAASLSVWWYDSLGCGFERDPDSMVTGQTREEMYIERILNLSTLYLADEVRLWTYVTQTTTLPDGPVEWVTLPLGDDTVAAQQLADDAAGKIEG